MARPCRLQVTRPSVSGPYCWRLAREARAAGIAGGFGTVLETLADIRLVVDLPAPGLRERPALPVTEHTAAQDTLFQHFDLAPYHTALTP